MGQCCVAALAIHQSGAVQSTGLVKSGGGARYCGTSAVCWHRSSTALTIDHDSGPSLTFLLLLVLPRFAALSAPRSSAWPAPPSAPRRPLRSTTAQHRSSLRVRSRNPQLSFEMQQPSAGSGERPVGLAGDVDEAGALRGRVGGWEECRAERQVAVLCCTRVCKGCALSLMGCFRGCTMSAARPGRKEV